MEATFVPKGRQRDEGGEEAKVMPRVHGQDPSDCGKTGGDTQERRKMPVPPMALVWATSFFTVVFGPLAINLRATSARFQLCRPQRHLQLFFCKNN